ncbi:MAG: hypothetical protein AAB250_02885 [Bdellovibrionota bacterium]
MFRISFAFLVVASALALNGCSQCSQEPKTEAPAATEVAPAPDAAVAPAPEAAPAAPEAAPVEATPAAQ